MQARIKVKHLPDAPAPTKAREVWLYEHHCISTHFPTPEERAEAHKKIAWSEEEELELISLYRRGRTYIQIAHDMERTEGSIRHKIHTLIFQGKLEGRYTK